MAIFERVTGNARRVWLIVAPLALLLSLAGPSSGSGVARADRIVLLLMHLAVGAVLIPVLYWTSPGKRVV